MLLPAKDFQTFPEFQEVLYQAMGKNSYRVVSGETKIVQKGWEIERGQQIQICMCWFTAKTAE